MYVLNLPSLKATGVHENEYDYRITAEVLLPPLACPGCGCKPNLYRFGVSYGLLKDVFQETEKFSRFQHTNPNTRFFKDNL